MGVPEDQPHGLGSSSEWGPARGPEQESPPPWTAVSLAGKWATARKSPLALQAGQTGGQRHRDPTVTAAPQAHQRAWTDNLQELWEADHAASPAVQVLKWPREAERLPQSHTAPRKLPFAECFP